PPGELGARSVPGTGRGSLSRQGRAQLESGIPDRGPPPLRPPGRQPRLAPSRLRDLPRARSSVLPGPLDLVTLRAKRAGAQPPSKSIYRYGRGRDLSRLHSSPRVLVSV